MKSLLDNMTKVKVSELKLFPGNPRIGDVDGIAESLEENGMFQPLVVQKSTGFILSGNHTYKAAVKLKAKTVDVVYVDVDDDRAKRIVLVANRMGDKATYDTYLMQEILGSIPDPSKGTGFNDEAVTALLEGIKQNNTETMDEILRPSPLQIIDRTLDNFEPGEGDNAVFGGDIGGLDVDDSGNLTTREPDQFKETDGEIAGAFTLKDDATYELVGDWHIPPLLPSMLVQPDEVPTNLIAWAGSASKDWPDENQWWLYNFGIDSTSGMKDISKMIMSFYAFDEYFECWWDRPNVYVAKMLNSGVKMSVVPDFSLWGDEPRVVSMFNTYRARWLGRFMQEAGVKVIPNLTGRWGDESFNENIVRKTLPKKCPVVSLQLRTQDIKKLSKDDLKYLRETTQRDLEVADPDLVLVYSGKSTQEVWEGIKCGAEVRFISSRLEALAAKAKGKAKKTTL